MDLDQYEAKLRHGSPTGRAFGLLVYVLLIGGIILLGDALYWLFWRSVFG